MYNFPNFVFFFFCFLYHHLSLCMENYASFWLFFGEHRLFLCMHLVFGCGKNATTVFNQGDEGRSWYILLKGSVDVVIHGKGTVATLKEGDDFGKLALINDAPRYVTTRSTVTFFVSVFVSVSFSFCLSCSLYLSSHFFLFGYVYSSVCQQ